MLLNVVRLSSSCLLLNTKIKDVLNYVLNQNSTYLFTCSIHSIPGFDKLVKIADVSATEPCSTTGVTKAVVCDILSVLWDGAYKRSLAVNRKE